MMPSNRQVHRESNEYASIWEWPLPNAPASATGDAMMQAGFSGTNRGECELPGSKDIHGYYGTYETRQFNSTAELSCRRVEHPYQHPGTPSSGRRCIVKDDVSSDKQAGRQRYFELNTNLNGLDNSSLTGCTVDVMSGAQSGGITGPVMMAVHGGRMPCYTQQYDIMANQPSATKPSTFLS
jgi:hypothetical protein